MGFKRNRATEQEDSIAVDTHKEAIEVIAKKIFPKVEEAEEKITVVKAEEKKEEVKKITLPEEVERKLNLGITGDTIEVKDFRAIVKKQGKQINIVLTKILSEWNTANYNL